MAFPLFEYIADPSACQYLADQSASNQYRIIFQISPTDFQEMLSRGWRRFGAAYFRPACVTCSACVPIRVPVNAFTPSKSQRRALRKCRHIRVEIGVPVVDDQRLELYARWHAMREAKRRWSESPLNAADYAMQFCFPHPCAREFRYLDGRRLVAVGYVDETPAALSSIYFFFDPACKDLSLGVMSVMCEIAAARERGLKYVYLGYRVLGCPSMEYKIQFRPHEILQGRPKDDESPTWVTGENAQPNHDAGV